MGSVLLIACPLDAKAQPASPAQETQQLEAVEVQGVVEVQAAGATNWTPAQVGRTLHSGDHLRTGADSRVSVRWSSQSVITFGAQTELEIQPPKPDMQNGLHLFRGILSFFHRDQPGRIQVITRGAVAGVEGTEFVMAVDEDERTTLAVIDGKVRLGNEQATLLLTNNQQAVVELGQAPVRTAGFIANNLLQWCFYYPAVLDLADLTLPSAAREQLQDSLAAYQAGDLLAALDKYPAGRPLDSDAERVYYAALLLSVGQVEKSETIMNGLTATNLPGQSSRLADALRTLIASVKGQPVASPGAPRCASEWLADSYYQQSLAVREKSLVAALNSARAAVSNSPAFGFAWERVAELEFCFGRLNPALKALDRSLELSPRNAQALALKGFILSAQNQTREALKWFDRALAVDAALGNAWLGRGLARIHLRDLKGGREDLLVAAALEPQRAELRSYLGKAYAAAGDDAHATRELDLAKKLDPHDPTAWLYSALQKQQNNEVNDAIRDLEKSQRLNNNRSVYRSQLLLDQDQAVRAADLASIYEDAGMTDVARQEAGRAVSSDYANYSAHLFLASSYNQLRDPNWSNLRYETPANSEFTIANLLAPGNAGWLNSLTAEQPYTRLFDQNRVGVVSDTSYLSRGAWTESGAQFGTYDNFSYSLNATYNTDVGQRANNDYEIRNLSLAVKDQFTPQDSAFFKVQQVKVNYGDVGLYYDPAHASSDFHLSQTQEPNLDFGYHHEWGPGSHTLFYASRQVAYLSAASTNAVQSFGMNIGGKIIATDYLIDAIHVRLKPVLNSVELQQILETAEHTTVVGTRYQWGDVHYENRGRFTVDVNGNAELLFATSPYYTPQDDKVDFRQWSAYAYHTWQITDSFGLTAGLAYDWLCSPANVNSAPFDSARKTAVLFSPKIGFIWQPADNTTFHAAYTRSLSGFINGQSTRIEPTEVAGFNQAYRSLIPESVAGDTSGSRFDVIDAALEQKFDTGTYLSLAGQALFDKTDKVLGAYVYNYDEAYTNGYPTYSPGFKQAMHFSEYSLLLTADQLLGKQWSVGARYRLSQANFDLNYPELNTPAMINHMAPIQVHQNVTSVLNTVNLHANWNHPSGLFLILAANWNHQNNADFTPFEPGDDFWQFNLYAGYRMWHRRLEFTVGLLNIFDQDYRLEPLNLYNETARSRTFLAQLRLSF